MIGLFNECFPPVMDGVSLTVSNLARCFYQQGRDVAVVTPEMPGLDESQLPYSVFQYRSFPIPSRHPYRYGFPSLDFKFQKQVAAQNFEILHAHCPFSSGDFALKTARRMGIPLVATFHSKYRDDFERVIPNKALVDYLVGKVVKFYESVDEVWVPQASVGETLREYGYKGTYEVVDNGTEFADAPYTDEMKWAAKNELYVAVDEPLLLFVGQHIWEKNVKLIIEALAKVKDLPYHALFVGDGYARTEMQAMAAKLGLSGNSNYRMDKVTFFGSVQSRELMQTIYTAEIIQDGINGFLSDNDVTAFANRLRYILERPTVISWAAKGAAETLVRPWEDIAVEVLDRYQHLIDRQQNRLAI